MRYLLDTGVWFRAVHDPQSIPDSVLGLLKAPRQTFGLASISLWEIGKKVQIGKLPLPKDLAGWLADALAPNIEVLPLNSHVVADAMRLPEFPNRDPADELIVATARVFKLTLMTTDRTLKKYSHAQISYFRPLATGKG